MDTNSLRIKKVSPLPLEYQRPFSFHGIKKMGAIKTVKTLTTVNQPDGFDCLVVLGLTKHSSAFEFCENGAKAVADEAMKGGVNPEFFAKYAVQELSQKSDFWLNNQGRITHPMVLKKVVINIPQSIGKMLFNWYLTIFMIAMIQTNQFSTLGHIERSSIPLPIVCKDTGTKYARLFKHVSRIWWTRFRRIYRYRKDCYSGGF